MQTKESAFTTQRKSSFGNMIIMIAICAGIAWLVLRGCSATTSSSIELPSIQTEASAEVRQFCENGKCIKVQMCTAVSGECGSMTPGPKADYGTGFHVSADGRTRPNPPAGWKWAGK